MYHCNQIICHSKPGMHSVWGGGEAGIEQTFVHDMIRITKIAFRRNLLNHPYSIRTTKPTPDITVWCFRICNLWWFGSKPSTKFFVLLFLSFPVSRSSDTQIPLGALLLTYGSIKSQLKYSQ